MLVTHLTFREIAEQMSLPRTTIKSQATSIHRKLGDLLTQPGPRPVP